MKKTNTATIEVHGTSVAVLSGKDGDYISLTDMLKAKDGEFFIADWLRNRNTVEFLGIWESVFNPDFNYGEFATIRSQAGLERRVHPHGPSAGRPSEATESNRHPPDADALRYGGSAAAWPPQGEQAMTTARVDGHLNKRGAVWN